MKTKNLLFIVFITLAILSSCDRGSRFKITGNIENGKDSLIYFRELKIDGTKLLDSAKMNKNGYFTFKGKIEVPKFYIVGLSESNFITLLVAPGEKVILESKYDDFQNYTVRGSDGSAKVKLLADRLISTKEKLEKALNEFSDNEKELNAITNQIIEEQRDSSIAFIVSNLNSMASIYALYQKINSDLFVLYKNRDIQYVKIVADALINKYPESDHVKALVADKNRLLSNYENLRLTSELNKMSEKITNVDIPDIYLPNLQGDTVRLSSINATAILVHFWASWNKESVQESVLLKDVYKRFHPYGFEIYQVSLDTKYENWVKAVDFDQFSWINVSDLEGMNSIAARIYNVQKVPTSFLIRNNRIVATNPSIAEIKRRLAIAFE